jgi:hypothetical protein
MAAHIQRRRHHHHHGEDVEHRILDAEREVIHLDEEIIHDEEMIILDLEHLHPTASISMYFSEPPAVGKSVTGNIVPLLKDGTTHSGGTISNYSFSIPSHPSFRWIDNHDSTITIHGQAVNTDGVAGTTSCTVTDKSGEVADFTAPFTINVSS